MEELGQLLGIQPSLGLRPQPGAEGHSLREWRHLVSYQEINPIWDWDLRLGLRAILWENGGTGSVTRKLTQSGDEGHSLGEWRHLVSYQEINPIWDWDLTLGLRAIL